MRRAALGVVVALVGAGCSGGAPFAGIPGPGGSSIEIEASPSPFSEVTAGSVRALVPDGWRPMPTVSGAREGFFASPRPEAWRRLDGSIEGMAATWVDATRVGVPSDFYYLVARGAVLSGLTSSPDCRAESQRVLLNNRPSMISGVEGSPGDYMARGEGTCNVRGRATRWAYFVAAPGFGPVRRLGIRRSGLYVVVAITRDSHRAGAFLDRLISRTWFGEARVSDFVAVVRGRQVAA